MGAFLKLVGLAVVVGGGSLLILWLLAGGDVALAWLAAVGTALLALGGIVLIARETRRTDRAPSD